MNHMYIILLTQKVTDTTPINNEQWEKLRFFAPIRFLPKRVESESYTESFSQAFGKCIFIKNETNHF